MLLLMLDQPTLYLDNFYWFIMGKFSIWNKSILQNFLPASKNNQHEQVLPEIRRIVVSLVKPAHPTPDTSFF